jgi:hypothetical protein
MKNDTIGIKSAFEQGAILSIDKDGKSPLDYAIKHKNSASRDSILTQLTDKKLFLLKNLFQKINFLQLMKTHSNALQEFLSQIMKKDPH